MAKPKAKANKQKQVAKPAGKAIAKVVMPKADNDANASNNELDTLIARITTTVGDLQRDVAIACAKTVTHAIEHGDVSYGMKLVAAFGESGKTLIRANLIRMWLETYGPFTWEDKKFKLNKQKRDELKPRVATLKDKQKFERELAEDCKPWEKKPEKPYKGINVLAIMKATIKRIESEAKKHADDPKTNIVYLDEFKKTLARVETAHADAVAAAAKAAAQA